MPANLSLTGPVHEVKSRLEELGADFRRFSIIWSYSLVTVELPVIMNRRGTIPCTMHARPDSIILPPKPHAFPICST